MGNLQPSTFNLQRRSLTAARRLGHWALKVFLPLLLLAPGWLRAQAPLQIPRGAQAQLQVAQPAVDVSSPVTATAAFDPPVVRVGEKAFYRVNVDATESSILWPDAIPFPAQLEPGAQARGQLTQFLGDKFRPLTAFAYELTATAAGHFTVTNFTVDTSGQTVAVPAASLEVVAGNTGFPPARRLAVDTSATEVFLGQPFRVRVMLPAGPDNVIEALREIQFNGDGLMTDKTALRQSIQAVNLTGQLRPAFVCELTVTPIAAGRRKISAQAFTAGREITGPITISGTVSLPNTPAKYVLLVSDPLELNVRPLPVTGELPGFTGAMGKFLRDPPVLATNRLRVGEPVSLKVVFHGEGDLTRFVPPATPLARDWQIIADPPPATGFTLIPLTDDVTNTPAIPFCYFDPLLAKYVDLTIPPLPVTVVGEGLPVQLRTTDDATQAAVPLQLSTLAPAPGKAAASLRPLQLRGGFVCAQLLPVLGFLALWQWDRRRRYLEAHPDIVRRRQARRALRREKRRLHAAVAGQDAPAFVRHAADALRIVVAPQYPANPRALVCGDVLAQLAAAERDGPAGETVRQVFAAADAQFALAAETQAGLIALEPAVETLLQSLEAKL